MKRLPVWLPYLQSITKNRGGLWTFAYKGGELQTKLDELRSIMIYGDSTMDLPVSMLDEITRKGIPIIIHRRNMPQAIYILAGSRPSREDLLTDQLTARANKTKQAHIARQLILAKMDASKWLLEPGFITKEHVSLEQLRNVEAVHAAEYWRRYFKLLGVNHGRRSKEPHAMALDAVSKFLSGVMLRWVIYHHMSPFHGFLHEPTTYPALVYDLLEPYRSKIEQRILQTWLHTNLHASKDVLQLTGSAINTVKEALDERIYCPLTRDIATRQELLHGSVLSLRAYVMGDQKRFLIPQEGKPNGGAPRKISWRLYGRHAGKTDFWQEARRAAKGL